LVASPYIGKTKGLAPTAMSSVIFFLEFTLKCGCFTFQCDLGKFGNKSMEASVLAETDEVLKTTIKVSTSSAERLFHLFFISFVDVDTYNTKLHQFYIIISKIIPNAIWEQIKITDLVFYEVFAI
jgi:hypothetical protein